MSLIESEVDNFRKNQLSDESKIRDFKNALAKDTEEELSKANQKFALTTENLQKLVQTQNERVDGLASDF